MRSLIVFLSLLFLTSAANASSVKLCNKDDTPLRLAIIYQDSAGGSADWVASGWITLPQGCTELAKSPGALDLYASFVRSYKHIGDRIMHFKFENAADKSNQRAETIEAFYCVQDGKFQRRLKNLNDHANCPMNYYHQLFNKRFRVPKNIAFTLDIGGSSE